MAVLLIGAGGHGAVVADLAQAAGRVCVGFADAAKKGELHAGLKVVAGGTAEAIELAVADDLEVVVCIGSCTVRRKVAEALSAGGVRFATLVHPTAWVSPRAILNPGTVVFAGAVVQGGTTVGAHAILNTGCTVDHDSVLQDYVHLSPGVHMGGDVTVGEGTHLGVGASVRNGVRIGAWSTIGVGSAVVGDIPSAVVAYGVPAKPRA